MQIFKLLLSWLNILFVFTVNCGKVGLLLFKLIYTIPKSNQAIELLCIQIYVLSKKTIISVITTGLLIGVIIGLHNYNLNNSHITLSADNYLLLSLLLRELAPIIFAFIITARIVPSITKEIKYIQKTEQLLSMESMGANPIEYLTWPRFWAIVIIFPILTVVFNLSLITGNIVTTVNWIGNDNAFVWHNIQLSTNYYNDILHGMLKTVAFGCIISWITIYQGFKQTFKPNTTNQYVEKIISHSYIAILIINLLFTLFMLED